LVESEANQLMAVDVPAGQVFRAGRPQALFKLPRSNPTDAVFDFTRSAATTGEMRAALSAGTKVASKTSNIIPKSYADHGHGGQHAFGEQLTNQATASGCLRSRATSSPVRDVKMIVGMRQFARVRGSRIERSDCDVPDRFYWNGSLKITTPRCNPVGFVRFAATASAKAVVRSIDRSRNRAHRSRRFSPAADTRPSAFAGG
jgi:hypothetical protein